MVTYDQYSQPDFFYESEPPGVGSLGAKSLAYRPWRRLRRKAKSDR